MNRHLIATAAALLLGAAGPASALIVQGSSTTGASVFTDYSGAGLLSFDLDLADTRPVFIDLQIEAADLGAPVNFSAVVRNFIGQGVSSLQFVLSSGSFDSIGSVQRFGGSTRVDSAQPQQVLLSFEPMEFLDLQIGDPLGMGTGAGSLRNWTLASQGFSAGDRFTLTVSATVPEPGTWALLGAGLGLLGLTTLRLRRR